MKQTLFKILDYELYDDSVEVTIDEETIKTVTVKIEPVYQIVRKRFEAFLLSEGKLEWILDEQENGEHKQSQGTYSLDEYWYELGWDKVTEDLYEYILFKFLGI